MNKKNCTNSITRCVTATMLHAMLVFGHANQRRKEFFRHSGEYKKTKHTFAEQFPRIFFTANMDISIQIQSTIPSNVERNQRKLIHERNAKGKETQCPNQCRLDVFLHTSLATVVHFITSSFLHYTNNRVCAWPFRKSEIQLKWTMFGSLPKTLKRKIELKT